MSHTEMVFKSYLCWWPVHFVPGGIRVFRRKGPVGLQQVRHVDVYRVMRP